MTTPDSAPSPSQSRRLRVIPAASRRRRPAGAVRLATLQRQTDLILNSTAEGIYGLDLDGRLTFINPAAAAMLGWSAADLLGRTMHDAIHHHHGDGRPYPAPDCPIYAALQDGQSHVCADEVFWRRDGQAIPVAYASNPLVENGRIVGAVVTFSDITERLERDRLQAASRGALAAAEALKDQFLSMVSHELRTPVSVILSSADILSFQYGPYVSESQKRHIDKITRSSQRLMGLLTDLLDVTQLQAGTFQLHRRPVQFEAVVDDALDSVEHLATQRHQRLVRQIPTDLPLLAADPDRLVQVLSNLLHNASKFTPTGGVITVAVTLAGGQVQCTVTDSGPGIDPAKYGLLFQRFSRLDEPIHPEGRSMGLGLFIAKALAEAHGGRIGVTAAPGGGCCFHVSLPLAGPDDDL